MLLLLTEGVAAFTQDSKRKYGQSVARHWIIQGLAAVYIIAGFASIYVHKNNAHIEHFTTSHGSTGLTTLLILAGASIGGTLARYNSIVASVLKPAQMKLIHTFFGLLAYSMATYTVLLATDSLWFHRQANVVGIFVIRSLMITNIVLVIIRPAQSLLYKLKNVFGARRRN